jgi:hypothetical protein
VALATQDALEEARGGSGPALLTCMPTEAISPAGVPARRGDPADGYARRLVSGGVPRNHVEEIVRSAREEVIAWM